MGCEGQTSAEDLGSGWTTILAENMDLIQDSEIENEKIPDIYRSSKATLNDH